MFSKQPGVCQNLREPGIGHGLVLLPLQLLEMSFNCLEDVESTVPVSPLHLAVSTAGPAPGLRGHLAPRGLHAEPWRGAGSGCVPAARGAERHKGGKAGNGFPRRPWVKVPLIRVLKSRRSTIAAVWSHLRVCGWARARVAPRGKRRDVSRSVPRPTMVTVKPSRHLPRPW